MHPNLIRALTHVSLEAEKTSWNHQVEILSINQADNSKRQEEAELCYRSARVFTTDDCCILIKGHRCSTGAKKSELILMYSQDKLRTLPFQLSVLDN